MDVSLNTSWLDIVKILVSKNTNFWLITTMLLVAYIGISKVFGFLCNQKFEENCKDKSNETKCAKLAKKDYTYLVVIVSIVAIFLISLSLYTNENAMSLFSFASTIASIILSVIAIILTITSETKNASTKEKIEKSAEQIQLTADLLQKTSENIDPLLLKDIGGKINKLDERIYKLDEVMEDAITKLEETIENTARTREAIEQIVFESDSSREFEISINKKYERTSQPKEFKAKENNKDA